MGILSQKERMGEDLMEAEILEALIEINQSIETIGIVIALSGASLLFAIFGIRK